MYILFSINFYWISSCSTLWINGRLMIFNLLFRCSFIIWVDTSWPTFALTESRIHTAYSSSFGSQSSRCNVCYWFLLNSRLACISYGWLLQLSCNKLVLRYFLEDSIIELIHFLYIWIINFNITSYLMKTLVFNQHLLNL